MKQWVGNAHGDQSVGFAWDARGSSERVSTILATIDLWASRLTYPVQAAGQSTRSRSPGFQVLSNQGSRGPYSRRITAKPWPGMVCTQ